MISANRTAALKPDPAGNGKEGCNEEDLYDTKVTQKYARNTSQASNHVSVRMTTKYDGKNL